MAVQKKGKGKSCGVSGPMASEPDLGKVARLNVLVEAFITKYHCLAGPSCCRSLSHSPRTRRPISAFRQGRMLVRSLSVWMAVSSHHSGGESMLPCVSHEGANHCGASTLGAPLTVSCSHLRTQGSDLEIWWDENTDAIDWGPGE